MPPLVDSTLPFFLAGGLCTVAVVGSAREADVGGTSEARFRAALVFFSRTEIGEGVTTAGTFANAGSVCAKECQG